MSDVILSKMHVVLRSAKEHGEATCTIDAKELEYLLDAVSDLKGEVEEMQRTLGFYAEPQNWELPYFGRGHSVVTTDRGNLARQALQSLKGAKS